MKILIAVLMMWLPATLGLPAVHEKPGIKFFTQQKIVALGPARPPRFRERDRGISMTAKPIAILSSAYLTSSLSAIGAMEQ